MAGARQVCARPEPRIVPSRGGAVSLGSEAVRTALWCSTPAPLQPGEAAPPGPMTPSCPRALSLWP